MILLQGQKNHHQKAPKITHSAEIPLNRDSGVYAMLGYNAWGIAMGLVILDCVKGLGGPADLLYILFGINLRLVDRDPIQ